MHPTVTSAEGRGWGGVFAWLCGLVDCCTWRRSRRARRRPRCSRSGPGPWPAPSVCVCVWGGGEGSEGCLCTIVCVRSG